MALSATKGVASLQQPAGGARLAPEGLLTTYHIAGPTDTSVTGFSVLIPGITVDDSKIVGLVPTSSGAGAHTGQYAVITAGTVSIYYASSNSAATDTWDLTVLQQA